MIRWLRPAFQAPDQPAPATQTEIDADVAAESGPLATLRPWPKTLAEQARAVTEVPAEAGEPQTPVQLAARFEGAKLKPLAALLETLVALGRARVINDPDQPAGMTGFATGTVIMIRLMNPTAAQRRGGSLR